jgi:hypothetical protein
VRNDASHAAMIEYLTAQMRSAAPKLHVNVGGKGLLIASVTPEAAPKAKKKALVAAFEKACDGLFAEFSPKPFKR